MTLIRTLAAAITVLVTTAAVAGCQSTNDSPAYGAELQGFDYPHPVHQFTFASQQKTLQMSYMDVQPAQPNGRTAVLLHGKNFCAATWEQTIDELTAAGYRVIAPDRIGFCKSSKPASYQFSFHQLAHNTHALLESLGIDRATVIGHSTGGMLAVRYGLMYPQETQQLVLVNPIGLEDWKAKGVPALSVDDWYARELKTTADGIRRYEQATYYAGQWSPSYEQWVQMLAGMYRGPGQGPGGVELGTALRHDLHAAGAVRIRPASGTDTAAHRPQGHDRDREGRRAAGGAVEDRPLSGAGQGHTAGHSARDARRVSRPRACAANAGSGGVPCGAPQGPRRVELAAELSRRVRGTRT